MGDPLLDQYYDWCITRLVEEKLGPIPVAIKRKP